MKKIFALMLGLATLAACAETSNATNANGKAVGVGAQVAETARFSRCNRSSPLAVSAIQCLRNR